MSSSPFRSNNYNNKNNNNNNTTIPQNEKQKNSNGRKKLLFCTIPSIRLKKSNKNLDSLTTTTLNDNNENNDVEDQRDLTKPRRVFVWVAEICAVISIFFAILMEIGSTYNRKALTNIYFIKLDLSHIIPRSIPNAGLINSVTQSLGLRDFYQVGLWGYCEGYFDQGVTYCSPPKKLFWFNPVEILTSQLLAGATIALPSELTSVLNIIKLISQAIFVCFLIGTVLMTVSLIFGWLPSKSRWWSGGVGFLSFLAAILHLGAAIASTIMYILFRAIFNYTEFSIGAYLGISMFVFMWMNAGFALTNFIVQSGLCCCGISKRKNRRKNVAENEKRLRWIEEHEERVVRSLNSSKNPSRNPSRTNSSKNGIGSGVTSGRTSPDAGRALDIHEVQYFDGMTEHEARRRRPPMPSTGLFVDNVDTPASGVYYEANEYTNDRSDLGRI